MTRGFEAFRRGAFGNAGQNLYVSRAGILQRIHLFDANRDGYLDLIFCNSQEFLESPPAFVYPDPLRSAERIELRSDGSSTGAVADLNGDGFDDLVLGMENNGVTENLNAFLYYGGAAEGLTERHRVEIPAPRCTSVAAGDFNGDGRADLAMVCRGKLRLFYQSALGFEPQRFKELDIAAAQVAAADLDGDGFADLYCLMKEGAPRVYWGGPNGINPARYSEVPAPGATVATPTVEQQVSEAEKVGAVAPLAKAVCLGGVWHLFAPGADRASLVPVNAKREFLPALTFDCANALSVAAGDVNGDGYPDLVFAARDKRTGAECSWIYWGGQLGFDERRRTALPSARACDVAVGDLNGDGCAEVALCQNQDDVTHSIRSPIYRGTKTGIDLDPAWVRTDGARRVFIARPAPTGGSALIFVNFRSRRAIGDAKPVIYFGGPDGFSPARKQEFPAVGAASALMCDVNDDGFPDLVIANGAENAMHLDPGTFVFLGGPNGLSSKPGIVLPTRHAWGLATADVNRDGFLELIVCAFDTPDLYVFQGTPGGFDLDHPQRIRMEADGILYDQPRRILLADLNNDGRLDLVVSQVARDRSFILWGGPEGFSFDRRQELAVIRGSCPEAADLTGNGYLDLLIGSHATKGDGPPDCFLYIYWNGPDGIREDRRTQLPAAAVLGIGVADFNNDGVMDILCTSYRTDRERDIDTFLYWGLPAGAGGPKGCYSPGRCTRLRTHSASGCIVADFNEDGWVDAAISNHKTYGDHVGDSFVWWNGPGGFDEKRVTRLPTTGPHGMPRVQPGNQRDRGPEEYYVSEPFELPGDSEPARIGWTAELPPKTWVRAQLRRAASRAELERAPWQGPDGGAGWFENESAIQPLRGAGRWLQYRLALGAVNSGNTPRVSEVRVGYA